MPSDTASLYDSDRWGPPQTEQQPYLAYHMPSAQLSNRRYSPQTSSEQEAQRGNDFYNKATPWSASNDFMGPLSKTGTLGVSTAGLQLSPTVFTSGDAQNDSYYSTTISPTNTRFQADVTSPGTDVKIPLDGQMHHTAPSNYATFVTKTDPPSTNSRCDSLQSSFESQSPPPSQSTVGRRRGSKFAEPGSARAIYLENNRKAASKCRGKQKQQQEELVEKAREVERLNKILKAEVEILKSGVRDLMELVGQHSNCPDARLRLYLQLEADRLATGGPRKSLPLSFSSSLYSGPSSVNHVSSQDDA